MKRSVTNFAPKVVSAEAERETTWATLSYSTWALCFADYGSGCLCLSHPTQRVIQVLQ